MTRYSLLLLVSIPAAAQITNVVVQGVSPTQAVVSYQAPSTSACTWEVSPSSTYTPLIHDVDPNIFTASNLDSRPESSSIGVYRAFVIGKRRAERQNAGTAATGLGWWYSRALATNTQYYFRITCGTSQATGTFTTENIPLGKTHQDVLPIDSQARNFGYGAFLDYGAYAYPQFVTNNQSEQIVDPQSGLVLQRFAMGGDQSVDGHPTGTWPFSNAIGSAWTNKNGILSNTSPATISGSTAQLFIQDTVSGGSDYSQQGIQTYGFTIGMASCSGACAGDNAKIQVAFTVDNHTPWQGLWYDITLPTTPAPISVPNLFADQASGGVLPNGGPTFGNSAISLRSGSVTVDVSGNVTYANHTGAAFEPSWTAGSLITINGQLCTIASVTNPLLLTITPSSCPSLSLPITSQVPYSAGNFGLLIRKKTASAETISLQNAWYTEQAYAFIQFTASGSTERCNPMKVRNSVTGQMGYVCIFPNKQIYWINPTTGVSNYVGQTTYGAQGGTDGFQSGSCNPDQSRTWMQTGNSYPSSSLILYCIGVDNATQKQILLKCQLYATMQPNSFGGGLGCYNLTPASVNADFTQLIVNFTSAHPYVQAYNAQRYNGGCTTMYAMQNNQKLIFRCNASTQDTGGWVVVFDPTLVSTNAGCVGAINLGQPGCVVAAQFGAGGKPGQPNRWCAIHALQYTGPTSDQVWIGGTYYGKSPGLAGGGYYISNILQVNGVPVTTLSATPTYAQGTNGCPVSATASGCDPVIVDGEPCDPSPVTSRGFGGTCPHSPTTGDYIQDAAVGDIFVLGDGSETVKLVGKADHTHWLIQRGIWQGPNAHSSTGMAPWCKASDSHETYMPATAGWIWYYTLDPYDQDSSLQYTFDAFDFSHAATKTNFVGSDFSVPSTVTTNVPYAYSAVVSPMPVWTGSPSIFTSSAPPFAGVRGPELAVEDAQNHGSLWHYLDTTVAANQWWTDDRPYDSVGPSVSGGGNFIDNASNVTGNLWKFTSTNSTATSTTYCQHGTVGSADGDNLTDLGYACIQPDGINRKLVPTLAHCGGTPLTDISGPSSHITGDLSTAYTYCIARRAGECVSGSTIGDIYANCPFTRPRNDGTFGCGIPGNADENALYVTPCLFNNGGFTNQAIQASWQHSDPTGGMSRALSNYGRVYFVQNVNEDVQGTPGGEYILFPDGLFGYLPPLPSNDTIARWDFVPVSFNLSVPSGLGTVTNAVIRFGYAENGAPTNYWCTSRQEACLATTNSINDGNPFQFGTDGSAGTEASVTGQTCLGTCSITVPALPGHILYYRIEYRNSTNTTVAVSGDLVMLVP